MSEHKLWNYVRAGMKPHWNSQRIEDRLTPGIPDICYAIDGFGWIELKYLPSVPKNPETVMRIDHLTPEQRNWSELWGKRTNRVFLLLQAGDNYLLFDHVHIRKIGLVTLPEHIAMARAHWVGRIKWPLLVDLLK